MDNFLVNYENLFLICLMKERSDVGRMQGLVYGFVSLVEDVAAVARSYH